MTIDIAKARALCTAATPGPWNTRTMIGDHVVQNHSKHDPIVADCALQKPDTEAAANAAFIAAARTLLPEALDEIERLRAEVAQLKRVAPRAEDS